MNKDELNGYKQGLMELLLRLEHYTRFSSTISLSEVLAMIENRIKFPRESK